MLRRRLDLTLLIVVLLCVPALTRAAQRLQPVGASQSIGLSRNCDQPPERIHLSGPEAPAVPVIVPDSNTPAQPERGSFTRTDGYDLLPSFFDSAPPDCLRAPPVLPS